MVIVKVTKGAFAPGKTKAMNFSRGLPLKMGT